MTIATLLTGLIIFNRAAIILDRLNSEQALAKPGALHHSIAKIVALICYWQEWFNSCARSGFSAVPLHADDGWPTVSADGWNTLRERHMASIEDAKRVGAVSDSQGSLFVAGATTHIHLRQQGMVWWLSRRCQAG